jgi:hypothetical protein
VRHDTTPLLVIASRDPNPPSVTATLAWRRTAQPPKGEMPAFDRCAQSGHIGTTFEGAASDAGQRQVPPAYKTIAHSCLQSGRLIQIGRPIAHRSSAITAVFRWPRRAILSIPVVACTSEVLAVLPLLQLERRHESHSLIPVQCPDSRQPIDSFALCW